MAKRCVWCARTDDAVREISVPMADRWGANPRERPLWVHGEHEDAFRSFAAGANRNGRTFLFGLVAFALAFCALGVADVVLDLDNRLVAVAGGAAVALLGVMLIRYPFATPETTSGMGIDLSIKMVRVYGGVFIAAGLAMAAFLR